LVRIQQFDGRNERFQHRAKQRGISLEIVAALTL
jgi:hypothetical protein